MEQAPTVAITMVSARREATLCAGRATRYSTVQYSTVKNLVCWVGYNMQYKKSISNHC